MPETQAGRQFVPQVSGGVFQCRQRLLLLPLSAPNSHFHGCVLSIRIDMNFHYFHRQQTRIGRLKANQLRQFLSYRFGDP